MGRLRNLLWSAMAVGLLSPAVFAADMDYARDVAPVLNQYCSKCHNTDVTMGGLNLQSEAAILKGGVSGSVVLAGKSADSLLIKRVLGTTDAPRMPMGGDPLPSEKVNLLRAWIDTGHFTSGVAHAPAKEASVQQAAESPVFAEKVRPILAARCYSCHGSDKQQNGLRLDSLAAIVKGSDSGKIVSPGKSGQSRLIARLKGSERPRMPYGAPPLTADEIKTIAGWIDAGAPGPDSSTPLAASKPLTHWAYVKPVMPTVPAVKNTAWVRNPIDNFILAKLEESGLHPSPEADKARLIRRVYLDLVGLPPSPKEVDAFVADKSPHAYEDVVDRLLASPRYGERWARPWLDLARYADTNGYEKDSRRTAWKFRDWVIRALNKDMPFREFTIEQIAGDLLPHPDQSQLIATGFHRNTMTNLEGGVDPEEYYWYALVDRVNTTGSVWLASTIGCAQCHNHKFDPFTQKDYYRLLAFFDNGSGKVTEPETDVHIVQEPELELPTPDQEKQSAALKAEISRLEGVLGTETSELETAQQSWEKELRAADHRWTALDLKKYESTGGASMKLMDDGSVLVGGKNPDADSYQIKARTAESALTAIRVEVLGDSSLPHGGPGRDPSGNFFLSAFEVTAAPVNNPSAVEKVEFKDATANEAQDGYRAGGIISTNPGLHGWAIDATAKPVPARRAVVLQTKKPFGYAGGTTLTITMKHEMRHSTRGIGRFRLSVTSSADPEFIVRFPARLWAALEKPVTNRTQEETQQVQAAYRAVAPTLDPTRKELKEAKEKLAEIGIVTAMTMRDKPGDAHPETYMRNRGSFLSKGALVYAGVPEALNPLPKDAKPNRLGLAEWLVSDDNPLTARVLVNRYWEDLYGKGLVETTEDFGTQSDPPSHPELLDWLAVRFMQDGWSMKKIKRLLVTSATYRQSSTVTPELLARDPFNKLYAHGPRFRVEGEMVHDIALTASGLLSSKMYGPSVMPYQPDGIWDIPYSDDKWEISKGEDRYRRSLYTFVRRSAPYPSLMTFDAPSREFCTVRRVRTNTPLQALTTLNDPFFFEAAKAMAERMEKEGGASDADKAAYGFRLCVSRAPEPQELEHVTNYYNQELAHYRQDGTDAKKVGGTPETAAWTMVANVLLNMDETVSKE